MNSTPPALDTQAFLRGNSLPERWRARQRFVLLQTGFGCGHAFLATWDAWRKDPQHCQCLHFIAFTRQPPTRDELAQAHALCANPALVQQLLQAWPPLTPNIHSLRFDDGQVQLLLVLTHDVDPVAEVVATVDAFYVRASDRYSKLPQQPSRGFKAIGRLAAPQATLACDGSWPTLHQDLRSVGFQVRALEKQLTLAAYAPRFTPRKAPARIAAAASDQRHALIVGAGLAGCACAWALAEQGWHSTVLDRSPGIAQAASGNPAGLFHGIVNPQDGVHARFNRAAALQAQQAVRIALDQHGVAGQLAGVLRLEDRYTLGQMRGHLATLGLPAAYVRALDAGEARELSGLPFNTPAWFYAGGGWVRPAGLAESFLRHAGTMTHFQGGMSVTALRELGDQWQLLDDDGNVLAQSRVVVMANALDAQRLTGNSLDCLYAVRGQTTQLPSTVPGLRLPRIPVTGAGYVLPTLPGAVALCGATSQRDGIGEVPSAEDHRQNLARLTQLTGGVPQLDVASLQGRVGWRCVALDHLPVIGAVPHAQVMQRPGLRLDQPRFVPRTPGLFVFTALGSRGITWAALGAQTLASIISGAPCPLEASLLDAVDVGRFASHRARRHRHRHQ